MFFGFGGILASTCGMLVTGIPLGYERYSQLLLILLSSICGYLAQTTLVLALRYEKAAIVSLIESLNVFFAFLGDVVIFGFEPDSIALLGSVLIIGSSVYVTCFSMKQKLDSQKLQAD